MNLKEQIEKKRAELAALEQQALNATCVDAGHYWQFVGGKNAGCDPECWCEVPVYQCSRCGDSDYGDNAEAEQIKTDCAGAFLMNYRTTHTRKQAVNSTGD